MCSQIYSNIIQVFTLFMKAIFPRSDTRPTQVGDACHMTQFEQSDRLRSENVINIMIEYHIYTELIADKSITLSTISTVFHTNLT